MFWFIDQEPIKGKKLSQEFQADLDRLQKNESLHGDLASVEISNTAEEVVAPAAGERKGDLHVVAHAGLEGEQGPWIGGMPLADFATALKKKFTASGLEGATIWLLVCDIGKVIDQLAALLAADPAVKNVALFAPTRLMFISSAGIPHVYAGKLGAVEMDKLVAKHHADFLTLSTQSFQSTGWGWAGGRLVDGVWKALKESEVTDAVKEKYDPEEHES